ncbi:hypothetical protein SDC9_54867 [bioreactor metagenome]|uniref:Uncharacterized protein n=1 Tax=bioreactor metagenome TaxID=1076179 RepID=A0A644X346_9ZZZZ
MAKQREHDRRKGEHKPSGKRPPVGIRNHVADARVHGEPLVRQQLGIANGLNHAARPAHPLGDHALDAGRGEAAGQRFGRGIRRVALGLNPDARCKVLGNRIRREPANLLQRCSR